MIVTPGIYQMTAAEYHADPCDTPSLSSSIANILLTDSPRHAWFAHPKLNPNYKQRESATFDLGTAAHAYMLEGADVITVIDAEDWRTKAAKDARDAARAEGKVPLLARQSLAVIEMAAAAQDQLVVFNDPPIPFTGGQPEQTLIWQEGGVWCRTRLDYLHDDHRWIDDLKSTGGSANPDAWTRGQLFTTGHDLQAAFYLRGLAALTGKQARFRFVVIENEAPYALSVISLTPAALAFAEKKVQAAITLWRFCMDENRWPGYPTRTCHAELPPWLEAQWMEREYREPVTSVDDGRSLADQLFGEHK